MSSNLHRCLLHNSWAIYYIIPAIFGDTFLNSDGRQVSTKDIAEQHCLEDFGGAIPTLQDWFGDVEMKPWMNGIGRPPSYISLTKNSEKDIEVKHND